MYILEYSQVFGLILFSWLMMRLAVLGEGFFSKILRLPRVVFQVIKGLQYLLLMYYYLIMSVLMWMMFNLYLNEIHLLQPESSFFVLSLAGLISAIIVAGANWVSSEISSRFGWKQGG